MSRFLKTTSDAFSQNRWRRWVFVALGVPFLSRDRLVFAFMPLQKTDTYDKFMVDGRKSDSTCGTYN